MWIFVSDTWSKLSFLKRTWEPQRPSPLSHPLSCTQSHTTKCTATTQNRNYVHLLRRHSPANVRKYECCFTKPTTEYDEHAAPHNSKHYNQWPMTLIHFKTHLYVSQYDKESLLSMCWRSDALRFSCASMGHKVKQTQKELREEPTCWVMSSISRGRARGRRSGFSS